MGSYLYNTWYYQAWLAALALATKIRVTNRSVGKAKKAKRIIIGQQTWHFDAPAQIQIATHKRIGMKLYRCTIGFYYHSPNDNIYSSKNRKDEENASR